MKRHTILIDSVSLQTSLALVPVGLYVNNRLEKLNPSEDDVLLTFQDTWHKHQVLLVSKCRLNLNTAVGLFIIRYMFGSDKTLQWLTDQWDAVAINEGFGRNSYSLDSMLLLHTREFVKEIYEEDLRIKQEREEALKQAAEREAELKVRAEEQQRLLDLAKQEIDLRTSNDKKFNNENQETKDICQWQGVLP